ncbi:MAG TPA: MFS transporter [Candidatus Polarisedimenticolia bacterium]|nr:MFS transporter [Candidatus Polarisedimenticolia bacterium]
METRRLYRAYSGFYFLYYAALGIYVPFFPLYLHALGISAQAVALLLALGPLSRFLFPAMWGLWADRSGHRKRLILISLGGACAAFALLFGARSFAEIAAAVFAYGFFLVPAIPLVEGMVQEESDRRRFAYGAVRLWGSLGFILTTLLYGRLLDRYSERWVVTGILALSVLNLLPAAALPGKGPEPPHPPHSLRRALLRRATLRFLSATTLMQASHAAYYAYFSLHLDRHGYTRTAIGAYWTLAVVAEIGMMIASARLLAREGPMRLIAASLLAAAVRWLMLALGTGAILLAAGQLLHALSYALFHVAAVSATHRLFPDALRSSGQSLYNAMTYGLGNLIGMLGCSLGVGALGINGLFGVSSAMALAALLALGPLPERPAGSEAPGDALSFGDTLG